MKLYMESKKNDQKQPLQEFSAELKEKLWLKPSSIITPATQSIDTQKKIEQRTVADRPTMIVE